MPLPGVVLGGRRRWPEFRASCESRARLTVDAAHENRFPRRSPYFHRAPRWTRPTALLRRLRSHRDDARARGCCRRGVVGRRRSSAANAAGVRAAAAAPKIQDVLASLVLDNVEAGRATPQCSRWCGDLPAEGQFRPQQQTFCRRRHPVVHALRKHAVEFSAQGLGRAGAPHSWGRRPSATSARAGTCCGGSTNDQGFNGGRELPAASAGADDDLMVPAVSFADVAGLPRVKAQVAEVVEASAAPSGTRGSARREPAARPAARRRAGHGEDAAGKGGRRRVRRPRQLCCSGSEFVEVFVGRGAKRVRTLFDERRGARRASCSSTSSTAAGGARSGRGGGSEEHEHTLNQLLAAMDGVTSTARVLVMGATNRLKALDAALRPPRPLRPRPHPAAPRRGGAEDVSRCTRAARRSRSARARSAPSPRAPPAGRAPSSPTSRTRRRSARRAPAATPSPAATSTTRSPSMRVPRGARRPGHRRRPGPVRGELYARAAAGERDGGRVDR